MEVKQKIYLVLTGIIILFLVIIFLVVPFLIGKIGKAASNLALQKEELEKIQGEQKDVLKWKKDYQEDRSEVDKIINGFITKEGAIDFIVSLEKIAQETGNRYEIKVVEKPTSSNQSADKSELLSFVDFHISLWGGFPNLLRFMVYLDNLSYAKEIQGLQIQGIVADDATKGVKMGDVSSVIGIRAYLNPAD
jgi:Na+-transporting methylmalonyl-CoA/oxaloacetate decarboxylase gamma subunit